VNKRSLSKGKDRSCNRCGKPASLIIHSPHSEEFSCIDCAKRRIRIGSIQKFFGCLILVVILLYFAIDASTPLFIRVILWVSVVSLAITMLANATKAVNPRAELKSRLDLNIWEPWD